MPGADDQVLCGIVGADDDIAFGEPDPTQMDTTHCPLAPRCDACGGTEHLRPVISAFTRASTGFDVGCATRCHHCDGQSFLHPLGTTGLAAAFARHTEHATGEEVQTS